MVLVKLELVFVNLELIIMKIELVFVKIELVFVKIELVLVKIELVLMKLDLVLVKLELVLLNDKNKIGQKNKICPVVDKSMHVQLLVCTINLCWPNTIRYTCQVRRSSHAGPDSVWRKKLTCQVAFGDLTTFENLIRSTGQDSKPDVCLEVSSGIPEQVSVINFAIKNKS